MQSARPSFTACIKFSPSSLRAALAMAWAVRRGSNRNSNDSGLSRRALRQRKLESKSQRDRHLVFSCNGCLRWRRNDLLFSAFPERRTAFGGSHHSCWRRGDHGDSWNFLFQRNCVVAKNFRNRLVAGWFVFTKKVNKSFLLDWRTPRTGSTNASRTSPVCAI